MTDSKRIDNSAAAWAAVEGTGQPTLAELFESDPDRVARLAFEACGIWFDWSKTHLDPDLLASFEALAAARGLAGARDALFAGGIVNLTEDRA
ncbi:MAG: glucose-6-phosphate isomerase, partial [Sphingomonadaceae bacterium]|nr:glucose-6-phosphate isomerase [Sphingomonadaceae bacterium]